MDDSSLKADQFVVDFNNAIKVIAKMNKLGIALPIDIWGNKRALREAVSKLQPYVDERIEAALEKSSRISNL